MDEIIVALKKIADTALQNDTALFDAIKAATDIITAHHESLKRLDARVKRLEKLS